MNVEFDAAKSNRNITKHGISLSLANGFGWHDAIYESDRRKDYGEHRIIGTGFIGNRLYIVVFVVRGVKYRIISLRKANGKERKKYEKEKTVH